MTLTGTHSCCVCFGLARTDITVTFEGLFWIFSAISLIGGQGARGVVSAIIIVQFLKIIQPCLINVRNTIDQRAQGIKSCKVMQVFIEDILRRYIEPRRPYVKAADKDVADQYKPVTLCTKY